MEHNQESHPFQRYFSIIFIAASLIVVALITAGYSIKKQSKTNVQAATGSITSTTNCTTQYPISKDTDAVVGKLNTINRSICNNIKTYLTATSTSTKTQLSTQLISLAKQRQPVFMNVVQSSPQKALPYVISQSSLTALPSTVVSYFELQTTMSGTIFVLHAEDTRKKGAVAYKNFLHINSTHKQNMPLYLTTSLSLLSSDNRKASIKGYRVLDSMLVDSSIKSNIVLSGLDSPNRAISGTQNVVVLNSFINGIPASTPWSNATLQDIFFNKLNQYYIRNSYSRMSIGTGGGRGVYGPFTFTPQHTFNMNDCWTVGLNYMHEYAQAAINASNVDWTTNTSNYLSLFINNNICHLSSAYRLEEYYTFPSGGGRNMYVSVFYTTGYNANATAAVNYGVMAHEFGHNLSLGHANSVACPNNPLPLTPYPTPNGSNFYPECSYVEYLGFYDTMAYTVGYFNAPHKLFLGWLNSTNSQTVTTSGIYRLNPLESENTSTSGKRALLIPRWGDYLYIEYRQPLGDDIALCRDQNLIGGCAGIVLNIAKRAASDIEYGLTYLVHSSPPYSSDYGTAQLLPGRTLTDQATHSEISIVGTPTSDHVDVCIKINGVPCGGTTPTPTPTLTARCNLHFSDVPTSYPEYNSIMCLACKGIVSGYIDGTFLPGREVSRGQMAKFISNAAGYTDSIPSTRQTFSDVVHAHPFWLFIERVALHGVVAGYSDGTFRPGNGVTRGQMAKFAVNAAHIPTSAGPAFVDVPPTFPVYSFIESAVAFGIRNNSPLYTTYACGGTGEPCPGTYFRPNVYGTRASTAKVIANAFFPNCNPANLPPPPASKIQYEPKGY